MTKLTMLIPDTQPPCLVVGTITTATDLPPHGPPRQPRLHVVLLRRGVTELLPAHVEHTEGEPELSEHLPLDPVDHLQRLLALLPLPPRHAEHLHLGKLMNPIQSLLLALTPSLRSITSRHGTQSPGQVHVRYHLPRQEPAQRHLRRPRQRHLTIDGVQLVDLGPGPLHLHPAGRDDVRVDQIGDRHQGEPRLRQCINSPMYQSLK